MELELKKAVCEICESVGEIALTQEETAETIVPDYCPDIARVIEAIGTAFVHTREIRDGKAEVSGNVQVSVLYTPEGESGIRTLEFSIPFAMESEQRVFNGCQCLDAQTELEFLETRMLNPRKLFTHCKLVSRLTGYRRHALTFASDMETDPRWQIEKRRETLRAVLLTRAAERDFTFTDEIAISPGRPGAVELLASRAAGRVSECRIIGNKLIFKGIFSLSILYRAEDGSCCSTAAELPFSQIMDVEGVPEDAIVSMRLQITGTDIQIGGSDPDGRQIEAALYLHALALLREERDLELLSDLYSTAYDVRFDAEPLSVAGFFTRQTRRQNVRELLEIGVVADSILSLRVSCGPVTVSREADSVMLRTGVAIRALYRDEGGVPLVAERRVEVSAQTDLPDECTVTAYALCPEEPQGSVGEQGIEVRFPVDFSLEASALSKKICVSSVELDPDTRRDTGNEPSLVLRCPGRDTTPWELAKAYHSTIAGILSANGLNGEDDIPRDTLILIPRKRA